MFAQTQPAADPGVYFVIAIILLVAVGTLAMVVLRFGHMVGASNAQARARRVKQMSFGAHPVMSRPLPGATPAPRVAPATSTAGNAWQSGVNVNDALNVNDDGNESEPAPLDRRPDINALQYREQLQTLAKLINAGAVAQAEGIEKLFDVTRSGRKDSRYAQIRADLLPLLKKEETLTPIAGRPTSAAFASSEEPA